MTKIAVATTSQLAADAAAEIADAGGNAVDCAIAAALVTMNTEPGVCALAGGAYVTVWPSAGDALTIDGNVAVPGLGTPDFSADTGVESVQMKYGGGIETLIGAASVAVPGSLAALDRASRNFGKLDWKKLFQPSIRAVGSGFPLPTACHYYLQYSGQTIFSNSRDGFRALHTESGKLRSPGSQIIVPHLADSLEQIAAEGSCCFYSGELAQKISDHVQANGGLLTLDDLQHYQPVFRKTLKVNVNGWEIATNPPPAIGGAVLCAMLHGFQNTRFKEWDETALQHLIAVQRAALGFRVNVLDVSKDVRADIEAMLVLARKGTLLSRFVSASTVHTSAVDNNGLAIAITASSGYGSGEMPKGTGLWLNNCLGEVELNRSGLDAGPVGTRLPSNMAPLVARMGLKVLAAGSPGADRITTALHQFLINFAQMNMSLADSINHSRLHLEVRGREPVLAVEPGLRLPDLDLQIKPFAEKGMYFGGVGAALYDPGNGFSVAADPRREGGTFISGR